MLSHLPGIILISAENTVWWRVQPVNRLGLVSCPGRCGGMRPQRQLPSEAADWDVLLLCSATGVTWESRGAMPRWSQAGAAAEEQHAGVCTSSGCHKRDPSPSPVAGGEERRDLDHHQGNFIDILKRGETTSEHLGGP